MYDVIIIGGGPGGLTAALYCIRANLSTLVIEKEFLGGNVSYAGVVENYPGFPEGISGFELAQKMGQQAQNAGVDIRYEDVISLDAETKTLETSAGSYEARALILSMGLRHKELEVPGEKEFTGRGVVYCTTCDGPLYAGKKTVVAGRGIPGITASLYLDEIAESVVLLTPTKELKAKEDIYLEKIRASGVTVITNAAVKEIHGSDKVEHVTFVHKDSGIEETIDADGIFVNIGKVPNTSHIRDSGIQLNKRGFIEVDREQMTSIEGIYAVGDVTTDPYKQISTAVGDGCKAALNVSKYLKK